MPKPSPHCSIKSGKAGRGASHAEYIGGVGKHAERDDVVAMVDKNIPTWAKDGVAFFDAADKLERANGRAYTEIEAAIPRGAADPVAYAKEYAEQLLGKDHPYRLAVHDKEAADGGRNIHMHLMFSDRKLDGIERDREQFFKRAAAPYRHRVTKELIPADPAKGGAGKDRKWNDRAQVQAVRDGWQAHAKAQGFDLDLRSNAAKGLEAPEPKLGPQHPRAGEDLAREQRKTEVERLREVRAVKSELHEINHQEKQHARSSRDNARHHQPATAIAEMRDVFGIDNVHDIGRPQDLLQPDAPGHVRPQQAAPDTSRLHELAAARAAAVKAERAKAQTAADLRQAERQAERDLRNEKYEAERKFKEAVEQIKQGKPAPAATRHTVSEAVWNERKAARLAARAAAKAKPIEPSSLSSGEAGPLTLPERLAASFAAMVAWVKEHVGPLADCIAADRKHVSAYTGPVVKIDELHAIQKSGRTCIVHRLDALDRKPTMSEVGTRIQYRDGLGTVTKTPDIERGKNGPGR